MVQEIPGPVWPERCGHGGYVGSFEWDLVCKPTPEEPGSRREVINEKCDLYVWRSKGVEKDIPAFWMECCIRHGGDDDQYYSPGGLLGLMMCREHEPYDSAFKMLMAKGAFLWEPKP